MHSLQNKEIINNDSNIKYNNKHYKSSSAVINNNNIITKRDIHLLKRVYCPSIPPRLKSPPIISYPTKVKSSQSIKSKKSYGIIALKIEDKNLYEIINEFFKNIKKSLYIHNGLKCNNINNIKHFIHIKENLKFLLISKKFSYAYYDFIHSKFNIYQNGKISKLLNEMSQNEFNSILTKSYKDLWATLHKKPYIIEYEKKFNEVRKKIKANDLLLNKKHYIYPEWEFPKGAKNKEDIDDIYTAIREFKEETNLKDEDFIVYNNINPIIENFIGSDDNFYTYYYYIALIKPSVKIYKKTTSESDNIGFYSYETAYKNFNRPIQNERRRILECIFNDIINWINKNYK